MITNKTKTAMISRVLRFASQRSTQVKSVRASKILKIAKSSSTGAEDKKRMGDAQAIPADMPRSQMLPITVDGSSDPYAIRIKKYEGNESGKRSRLEESTFSVKALAITGNSCQNRKTGQSSAGNQSTLPLKTKYHAVKPRLTDPIIAPMPKPKNMNPRATTSMRPRTVRKEFTKSCQRTRAIAANWPRMSGEKVSPATKVPDRRGVYRPRCAGKSVRA